MRRRYNDTCQNLSRNRNSLLPMRQRIPPCHRQEDGRTFPSQNQVRSVVSGNGMKTHFFTVEPSLAASRFTFDNSQAEIVNKAMREGRLIRVEVGQFMSETFLWGVEVI